MASALSPLPDTAPAPYSEKEIQRRIDACPKLASLQSINRALSALLHSEQSLNSQIAEIIRRDSSLSARLLRIVNSVYFGLSARINNIEEAVFFLGLRQIRELSLATAEAEKTVQEKSDFLAGRSHDLRTPLNAMFGFTTILLQERAGSLNLKQRGYLEQIRHAAEHLQSLISDILDLSRIEAGFLDLRAEEFPLEDALGEVIETIAPLADAKAIRVCCAPADLRVAQAIYADRTRFLQILFNLLSNAIKFTSRGGTVSVSATTLPGGGGNLSRGYGPGHSARGTDRDLREVSSGPSARRRGWRRAWPDHNTPSCGTTRR